MTVMRGRPKTRAGPRLLSYVDLCAVRRRQRPHGEGAVERRGNRARQSPPCHWMAVRPGVDRTRRGPASIRRASPDSERRDPRRDRRERKSPPTTGVSRGSSCSSCLRGKARTPGRVPTARTESRSGYSPLSLHGYRPHPPLAETWPRLPHHAATPCAAVAARCPGTTDRRRIGRTTSADGLTRRPPSAASASCDSADVRTAASVSRRPCHRTAVLSNRSGLTAASNSR
jgi:hypothetical protein